VIFFPVKLFRILLIIFALAYFTGCSHIPLKDGGLKITEDTIAGIDDIGVGRVTKQF
jgi:hypothetical protein